MFHVLAAFWLPTSLSYYGDASIVRLVICMRPLIQSVSTQPNRPLSVRNRPTQPIWTSSTVSDPKFASSQLHYPECGDCCLYHSHRSISSSMCSPGGSGIGKNSLYFHGSHLSRRRYKLLPGCNLILYTVRWETFSWQCWSRASQAASLVLKTGMYPCEWKYE